MNIDNINMIILTTGFGVERGLDNQEFSKLGIKLNSYWRNDSFSQSDLSKKDNRYLITGNGDGGLVEVFRILIDDYFQDESLEELIPLVLKEEYDKYITPYFEMDKNDEIEDQLKIFKNKYNMFVEKLRELKKSESNPSNSLFMDLDTYITTDYKNSKGNLSILTFIKIFISSRLTLNTVYFLIRDSEEDVAKGKNNIELIMDNVKNTFYNRILFYFVWSYANIEIIRKHNLDSSNHNYIHETQLKYNIRPENIIIRHGANVTLPIENFFIDSGKKITKEDILEASSKKTSSYIEQYRYDKEEYLTILE